MRQILPLDIPPGFVRDGTELQTAGRWRDGSLIRWRNGVMQPVGGWSVRIDGSATIVNPPRAALAWLDNTGDKWVALGTSAGLFVFDESDVIEDITPVGLTVGIDDAQADVGYGGWFYGLETYGDERPEGDGITPATVWTLDTWGENLVGVSDADSTIYEWALNVATPAAAIAGAPTADAIVVTEERFLFALGAAGNPRLVQWSDREDNTTWTPAPTNEAGDYLLPGGTRIQCGLRMRGQTLILTDRSAYTATYQGPPFVYGFEQVGTACGAISRHAAVITEAGAFWMGQGGFHRYAGGAAEIIGCDVLDYLMRDLNMGQKSKVHAVANTLFGEVWWFYPSGASNENDSYVAFNYRDNHWMIGRLARTCGVDASPLLKPNWIGPDGVIYAHETGSDWGGAAVYAEAGPVNFANGTAQVLEMFPDERTQGQVTSTFKVRDYPTGPETSFGPYAMAEKVDLRFTARQVRLRVDGAASEIWSVGVPQLRYAPRGTR